MRGTGRSGLRHLAFLAVAILLAGMASPARAQQSIEITKSDITKQNTIDASRIAVFSIRLGDARDQALKTLQRVDSVKVQEDKASGRIFVYSPANSNTVVMSVRAVEGIVTTINLVGGFGEWLQGDTKTLFRGFEDDSLRHKLIGREDQRQVIRGGTKEAPGENVTYSYYKEGILFSLAVRQTKEPKKFESIREMVLMFPARAR